MKPKYKLKSWVIFSVYFISLCAIISSLYLVGKVLKSTIYTDEALSYVYHGLINDSIPVVSYSNESIIKPFSDENVKIIKNYYDKDSDNKTQENSLLLYEKTYMPNTGILYSNDTSFDILCVIDGTVESIVADEIMGNIITVKHSNNLSTIYQSVNEVQVLIGDVLKQGDVIGNSGINKLIADSENMLLFEVVYNGTNLNPETFFNSNLKDLS